MLGSDASPASNSCVGFGVNALTGRPLVGRVDIAAVAETAVAEELLERSRRGTQDLPDYHPTPRGRGERGWGQMDPHTLDSAGWGVIFAADEAQSIKDAVSHLIEHRQSSAIFTYNPGESFVDWIKRNGGEPGSGDSERIPYYLCIVGGPDQIPFEFQFGLDIEYAVGRICFDQPSDYDQYIQNLREYEDRRTPPRSRRQAVLMGATNTGDDATALSSRYLVLPLATRLARRTPIVLYLGEPVAAEAQAVRGEMTKESLAALLRAEDGLLPTVVFTASHGWAYPEPDNRQRLQQGALVCQGWRSGDANANPDWLFAARDVPAEADLRGMVLFAFACFSAGTPQLSYYRRLWGGSAETAANPIAAGPFVAALPKKLLSRPNGPLGFFGHVEQTWATSFSTPGSTGRGATITAFERAIKGVLDGYPLGHALGDFNDRNSSYSLEVSKFLEDKLADRTIDEAAFTNAWLERNDARGYILLGDPGAAVRAYELQTPA